MSVNLMRLAQNIHSQNGEDGILRGLFEILGVPRGYFVEFGAWDGIRLSNTAALREHGWAGCYIEGDPRRYRDLVASVPQPDVVKVCRFVAISGPDSLESILLEVGAPPKFDLLSIDIDSDDLAVWRSLCTFRPRCVVIEYNPTIPFDCVFENPPGRAWGNSALAIDRFAQQCGYHLVAGTHTNLVYLEAAAADRAPSIKRHTLSDLPVYDRYYWGYDGTLIHTSSEMVGEAQPSEVFRVPWTGCLAFQPIPRPLRGYEDQRTLRSIMRQAIGLAIVTLLRPVSLLRWLRGRRGIRRDADVDPLRQNRERY